MPVKSIRKHAPETTTSNPKENSSMPKKSVKKVASQQAVSPTAPVTTASSVVLSTTPPVADIPPVPKGANPVLLAAYLGSHPRSGQVAAAPDVCTELTRSNAYDEAMGANAPKAALFAQQLGDALQWTRKRVECEGYTGYLKSGEAVTWKAALETLDEVREVYEFLLPRNPELAKTLPALTRMLDVTKAIGHKAAATRSRKVKANAKAGAAIAKAVTPAATPAPAATTAPVATPSSATGAGGGDAH
jgi:hypothetical protein